MRVLDTDLSIERNNRFTAFRTLFSRYQDNTICRTGTIDGCTTCIFQDRYIINIVRVQIVQSR